MRNGGSTWFPGLALALIGACSAAAQSPSAPQPPPTRIALDGTVLTVVGNIDEDAGRRIIDALTSPQGKKIATLAIDSVGGDIASAIRVGSLVRERHLAIRIERACATICTLILPATDHLIAPDGKVAALDGHMSVQALAAMLGGPTADPRLLPAIRKLLAQVGAYYASFPAGADNLQRADDILLQADDAARAAGLEHRALIPDAAYLHDCLGIARVEMPAYTPADSVRLGHRFKSPTGFLIGDTVYFDGKPLTRVVYDCALPRPAPAAPGEAPAFRIDWKYVPPAERTTPSFEMADGVMTVRVRIGGYDVWALVDNGMETSIVDLGLARKAGLALTPSGMLHSETGLVGHWRTPPASFAIAGLLTVTMPLSATDLGPMSRIGDREFGMVIARDLLSNLTLVVANGQSHFLLMPGNPGKMPAAMPSVPLTGKRPTMPITINGRTMQVTLDTGMNGALVLSPQAWARVGPADAVFRNRLESHVEGQPYETRETSLPAVKIASLTASDVKVVVRPLAAEFADGIVGMGLLSRFDLMLDLKDGRLWLTPKGELKIAHRPATEQKPAAK